MHVGIIGSGNVGITSAFAIAEKGSAHVTLYGRTPGQAKGKALDLAEASPLRRYDIRIDGVESLKEIADHDILVLAAGAPRTEGKTRFDMLEDNLCLVHEVADALKGERTKKEPPVTIVLTEPVDLLTAAFAQATGYPRERVMGIGGLLSSSRLRHFVARELDISAADVDAMVVGTHGEKMLILERYCRVSGLPLDQFLSREQIDDLFARTVTAGTDIVDQAKRGSSFYTPGAAVGALVQAITRDSGRVLSVSTPLDGEYGVTGRAASVPAKIGKKGVRKIYELKLDDAERAAFATSIAEQEPFLDKLNGKGVCDA